MIQRCSVYKCEFVYSLAFMCLRVRICDCVVYVCISSVRLHLSFERVHPNERNNTQIRTRNFYKHMEHAAFESSNSHHKSTLSLSLFCVRSRNFHSYRFVSIFFLSPYAYCCWFWCYWRWRMATKADCRIHTPIHLQNSKRQS